jgi:hypothetical protein
MRPLKAPTRFLLRGSTLLVGLLTIWWFVLLDPMLSALQGAGDISARLVFGGNSGEFMRENGSRNWTFRLPEKIIVPASPVMPMPLQIDSVDFDVARTDIIGFTFSLPVFWAVVLAARGWRRNLRPLLAGTGLIVLIELILLLMLTFAASSAHKAAAAILSIPLGAFETWLLSFSDYLTVMVAPYFAPILVAFAVHHELRRDVFGWSIRDQQPPAKSSSNRNSPLSAGHSRKTAR